MDNIGYIYDDIESCEMIGEFNDEYVYDVEVDDDTHTFIANDILVHNSLFVSFKPGIDHCTWKDLQFDNLDFLDKKFIVLSKVLPEHSNSNCVGMASNLDELRELLTKDYDLLIFDGEFIKNRDINSMINDGVFTSEIKWNWSKELDLIQGMDHFRYGGYFKKCLEEYAASFGVENKEDFELEKISESIINIAKNNEREKFFKGFWALAGTWAGLRRGHAHRFRRRFPDGGRWRSAVSRLARTAMRCFAGCRAGADAL